MKKITPNKELNHLAQEFGLSRDDTLKAIEGKTLDNYFEVLKMKRLRGDFHGKPLMMRI